MLFFNSVWADFGTAGGPVTVNNVAYSSMWRFLRKPAALAAFVAAFFFPSYVPVAAESQASFEQARLTDGQVKTGQRPGLWRIQGQGGPVWLFGTIHVLPGDFNWRSEPVDGALNDADVVVLEAPVGGDHARKTVAIVRQYAQVHPNQSIRALVPDYQQPRAQEITAQYGLPWAQISGLPPWLGGIMLAQSLYTSLGFTPESGVEHSLIRDPALRQKEWEFFETPEEQLGFFADQPADVQVEMFLSTLTQMEEGRDLIADMFKAWASGDVAKMDALFNKSMKEQSPELFDTLIVDRNLKWIPKIEAMLRDPRTYFIAVGAGHLGGDHGVIALLEERGYAIDAQ